VQSVTPTTLQLQGATASGAAIKFTLWRTLTTDGIVAQIGTAAAATHNRRIQYVFPSYLPSAGIVVPGYHLCAALAGLTGSSAPQQALTHVSIEGFDNVKTVTQRFTRSQLNTLANYGVWIVTEDSNNPGVIYTRHALSSDLTDLNTQEQQVTKNLDSISFLFQSRLNRFIGRANVTPQLLELMNVEISAATNYLKTNGYVAMLGGQLIDAQVLSIRSSLLAPDSVIVTIKLTLLYPNNNDEIHLQV
jgi:hypothetical protein